MTQPTATGTAKEGSAVQQPGDIPTTIRYRVLLLTFALAFIMYLDRTCMGLAAPTIMKEFHLDKVTMGWSASAFNAAYAMFQIPAGWMADRFGPRIVLAAALAWWSIFTAATGLSYNALSLAVTRFLFGAGEAAAFPASSRAIVRWLPVRQRAFGQGFQHAGSRLGAALAPTFVVFSIAMWSWQQMFFILGGVGVIGAVVWYWAYRNYPHEHSGVNAAELELLDQANAARRNPLAVFRGGASFEAPMSAG